jgi:hypothetical protein
MIPLGKPRRFPPYGLFRMPIEKLNTMEGELPLPPFEQRGEREIVPENGREAETSMRELAPL